MKISQNSVYIFQRIWLRKINEEYQQYTRVKDRPRCWIPFEFPRKKWIPFINMYKCLPAY